jgi:hypothetical protein
MEFFVCPCPATGRVMLDGEDQGPNKNADGVLLPKECNAGGHRISLRCADGKACIPPQVDRVIANTDPILPLEVPFRCAD